MNRVQCDNVWQVQHLQQHLKRAAAPAAGRWCPSGGTPAPCFPMCSAGAALPAPLRCRNIVKMEVEFSTFQCIDLSGFPNRTVDQNVHSGNMLPVGAARHAWLQGQTGACRSAGSGSGSASIIPAGSRCTVPGVAIGSLSEATCVEPCPSTPPVRTCSTASPGIRRLLL